MTLRCRLLGHRWPAARGWGFLAYVMALRVRCVRCGLPRWEARRW